MKCATPIESLLRLHEWGTWLTERRAQLIGKRVRNAIESGRVQIPFFKVTKAFLNASSRARDLLLHDTFLPLMRHFGAQAAELLPPPGPAAFVQPGNHIHVMSFLLYAVVASSIETRLILFFNDQVEEVEPIPVEEVGAHLADGPGELEHWLLTRFGGLTSHHLHTYDFKALADQIAKIDPAAPLILDCPFSQNMEMLSAIVRHERVFNLNDPLGASGEVSLAYDYFRRFELISRRFNVSVWARRTDQAAERFTECLDRLRHFQRLAEGESKT